MNRSEVPNEKMLTHLTGKASSELPKKRKAIKFPVKLMYALECGLYDHIISWCPSGLAFVIMKPESFANRVLPELFSREAKFSSFDRKIKRWGFVKAKVNRGTISCCYGHSKFQKGNYQLCMTISCSSTTTINEGAVPSAASSIEHFNATGVPPLPSSSCSSSFFSMTGPISFLRNNDPIHTARLTSSGIAEYPQDAVPFLCRTSPSSPFPNKPSLLSPPKASFLFDVGYHDIMDQGISSNKQSFERLVTAAQHCHMDDVAASAAEARMTLFKIERLKQQLILDGKSSSNAMDRPFPLINSSCTYTHNILPEPGDKVLQRKDVIIRNALLALQTSI